MRHLLKTTALASSLVAASFVVGAGMARAQTADSATATFNASAPSTCAFGAPTGSGELVNFGAGFDSVPGTSVNIPLLCSSTSQTTLSVDPPVQTIGPALAVDTAGSRAQVAAGEAFDGLDLIIPGTIIDENVVVDMFFIPLDAILPGNYQFTVTVTATPD